VSSSVADPGGSALRSGVAGTASGGVAGAVPSTSAGFPEGETFGVAAAGSVAAAGRVAPMVPVSAGAARRPALGRGTEAGAAAAPVELPVAVRARAAVFAGVFLAGVFLAGVFLADVFLAGVFLAGAAWDAAASAACGPAGAAVLVLRLSRPSPPASAAPAVAVSRVGDGEAGGA